MPPGTTLLAQRIDWRMEDLATPAFSAGLLPADCRAEARLVITRPGAYRSVATVLNRVLRLVPTSWEAAIAATAIRAAIRPYSIAVAPTPSCSRRITSESLLNQRIVYLH
jgi:hypothetical protein